MKKWIAILLALLLCVPVCAALSEEEPLTVNWSGISPILAAYGVDGEFVTLDSIGLKVFLFPEVKAEEISPEDAEAGLLYDFTVANGKYWLRVVTVDVGEEMTLDAFYEMARKDTSVITNVNQILVNGLSAVTYDYVEGTSTGAVLADVNGHLVNFTLGSETADKNEIALLFAIIFTSIQPAE